MDRERKSVSEPNVRGRGRPRTFDREEAVAAALRLFRRRGYEGTSLAELTRELGIAAPSLYAAFGSKSELFAAAVRRYVEDGAAVRPSAGEPGRAGLAAWSGSYLRNAVAALAADGVACLVSNGMPHGCADTDGVAGMLAERRGEMLAALVTDLGVWFDRKGAEVAARFVLAVLQGLSMQVGDGADVDGTGAVVDVAVDALLALFDDDGDPSALAAR